MGAERSQLRAWVRGGEGGRRHRDDGRAETSRALRSLGEAVEARGQECARRGKGDER
jgi:hypothetical protein